MMNRVAPTGGTPSPVAVVRRGPDRYSALILQPGAPWQLLHESTFEDPAEFIQECRRRRVARVVRLAPARECVARAVSIPEADEATMAATAALLAEAELAGDLPAHRRAAGVIPGGEGLGSADVLLTGWTTRSEPPPPLSDLPETWVAPVAALAMLKSGATRAAAYADEEAGVLHTLIRAESRRAARTVILPTEDEPFSGVAAQALEETARAIGAAEEDFAHAASLLRSGQRLVLAVVDQQAARERVTGWPDDPAWFERHALLIGAAFAAAAPSAALRPLAGLLAKEPQPDLTVVERVSGWISTPRHAWMVIAASLLLVVFGPLAVAATRYMILDARASAITGVKGSRDTLERTAALYDQLEQTRWPMTKLLADISSATPVGVEVTSLRLSKEQGIQVQGKAESSELVNQLQANLNKTRVFKDVKVNRVESKDDGSVEFDVTADASQPHAAAQPVEDFAKVPLAERLYGKGASNDAPRSSSESESRGSSGRRDRSSERTSERAPAADPDRPTEATRRPAAPEGPPPPLTDEAIAAMDRGAAMKEFGNRRKYLQSNSSLDAATKQRISDEVEKLKAQMAKLAGGA